MTLAWANGDSAVNRVRARVATMRYDGEDRLWDLEPLCTPWREQRRLWVRVAATGPMTVTEIVDDVRSVEPKTASGELLDISEIATRYLMEARAIWACRRNARVRASFSLGVDEVELDGRVIASRVSGEDAERREIVMLFDQPVAVAETLRRHVHSRRQAMPPGPTP